MNIENEYHSSGYFSIIPANVLYSKTLKPNEKLLYAIITSLSNKEGYCYASKYILMLHPIYQIITTPIHQKITRLVMKR